MMTASRIGWTVFLLLVAATSAPAETEWLTYSAGRAKAVEEGRPMLLFFDLADENSEFFLKEKWTHEGVQLLAKRFVLVRIPQSSRSVWKRYGIETGPAIRLTDSEGDVIEKGWWRSATALHEAMKETLRKFGPILSPAVRAEAEALTAEIRRAMSAQEFPKALEAARKLRDLTREDPYATTARKTRQRLADYARSLLERKEKLEKEGRYWKAQQGYREVVAKFPGLPAAEDAARHLKRFEKTPGIRKRVEEQRAEEEAREALDKATKLDRLRPDRALEAWEKVANDWPDTPAGKEAARLAWERRQSPTEMARVREAAARAVCPAYLSMAQSYAESDRPEEARKLLERVLAEHPGTSYAAKAAAMLKELK
jgi:tetratricopeptide (TPR) repeat protein